MNTRNKIIEHYKKFFDLHAKGIALDEDDHLNLDWATALIEDLTKAEKLPIHDVSHQRELLFDFEEYWNKNNCDGENFSDVVDRFLANNSG